jgi:CO/xanthine dehydrogenase Mo-binding subunit/aerobic-type carbon monoxide dehydrogenase small subunit (CoxS/CutS family)
VALTIIVNGVSRAVPEAGDGTAAGQETLLDVLRDRLGVTGPKYGCGEGACGACTVLIGRRAVAACQVRVSEAAGQRVTTAEGLAQDGLLHPVQQAWLECGAMQCGYCTPGWLTATAALLARVPRPDDARIAAELTNICRCGTYPRIRQAVHRAAALTEDPERLVPAPPPGPGAGGAPAPGPGAHAGRPWDLASGDPESFAADMPEGLMTVVPGDTVGGDPVPGAPGRPGLGPNDAWVHVGADGAVTAYTGKVEAGQGTRTALARLVADGLGVPVTSVTVVMGDTGISPFDAGTFGSRSMPYAVPALRAAAAAARRLLTEAAGRRFGLPPDLLRAAGGMVAGPDGAPSASYGDLVAGQRRVEVASAAETLASKAGPGPAATGPGQAGPAHADAAQAGTALAHAALAHATLSGAGRASAEPAGSGGASGPGDAGGGDDADGVTPGMGGLRAERLAAVAAGAAGSADIVTGAKRFPADLRLPGMLHGCVLRAPSHGATLVRADTAAAAAVPGVTVVADGSFVGVAGVTRSAARRALGLVTADWAGAAWDEPEPVTPAGLESWLRSHPADGSGPGRAFSHEEGDAAGGLAAGAVRRSARYHAAYIAHVPMEPRSALACWDAESGRLTAWFGTSTPFRARAELATALGLAQESVQVIVPDYGGGFGGKHGSAVALDAARLARGTGRPVHVQWSRQEEFQGSYLRPAAVIDVAGAAGAAGRLTGWSVTNINSGAVGIVPPYRIGAVRAQYQPAVSPLAQGAYRALAATANSFARESMIDELATAAGLDPVEFRLRNLGDDRLAAVLRAAAAGIGWGDAPGPGPGPGWLGDGIALGMEKGGRVATAARVHVGPDGALRVLRLVTAVDCGAVIYPDGLVNQVEGAVSMGLGGALLEAIDFTGGHIVNAGLAAYRVPRLADLPDMAVVVLDQPERPSAGGGETPIIAVAPAIGNAIYRACGTRLRSMPMAPDGRVPLPSGAG